MDDSLERSFGIIIAYLAPGFVCLAAVSPFSATVAGWLAVAPTHDPTLGSFLYVILSSLSAGLVVNAFRWVIIDSLIHHMGVPCPKLDFSKLEKHLGAFQLAVEHNYRHYQFYAGMGIAVALYAVCDELHSGLWPLAGIGATVVLIAVLLLTARECLSRYYRRTEQMMGKK